MKSPLIIAHRGASAHAPENTIAAFEQAIALNADLIEFDVRRTLDHVLVIHHDATLHDQLLQELTWTQVRAIAPTVPTLEAAIDCCRGRIRLDVELKEAGYEANVVALLLKHLPLSSFVVTSFDLNVLEQVHHHAPDVRLGFLVNQDSFNPVTVDLAVMIRQRLQAMDIQLIAPHWQLLESTSEMNWLEAIASPTMNLWVWTVDDQDLLKSCLHNPRITGIITNRPDLAIWLREGWRQGWRH